MSTIAWGNYTNQILAMLKGSSLFSDVDIFDGFELRGDNANKAIVIGNDGIGASQAIAGAFIADFDNIGAKRMKESGILHCYLYANSGDSDTLSTLQNTVNQMLSNFDTLLRTDPSEGKSVQYSGIHDITVQYLKTTRGDGVKITFHIQYTAIT